MGAAHAPVMGSHLGPPAIGCQAQSRPLFKSRRLTGLLTEELGGSVRHQNRLFQLKDTAPAPPNFQTHSV